MHRFVVSTMILVLCTLGWMAPAMAEQPPAPRGELRIVDTSSYNFITVAFNVFEHLLEADADGRLVPRLATSWQWHDERTLDMTLRQGVTFHNGEIFNADIVKLNWDENTRLQQPFAGGQFLNFFPGSRLEILAPYTVRFHFPKPDGAALIKLSSMHLGSRQFWDEHGWGEKSW